jgi:hypothetical protein
MRTPASLALPATVFRLVIDASTVTPVAASFEGRFTMIASGRSARAAVMLCAGSTAGRPLGLTVPVG